MKNSYKDYLPENVSWFRLPEYLDNIRSFVTFSDLTVADGIISGGVIWKETGLEFESSEIVYTLGNVRYTAAPVDPIILEATQPGLDRIDVFAVNDQGELIVIQGEESANPSEPDVIEGEQVKVSFALIVDGQVVPPNITNIKVYDENLQVGGGEWNTSTIFSSVNLASTADSQSGSVSVRFLGAANNVNALFTNTSVVNVDSTSNLVLRLKPVSLPQQGLRFSTEVFLCAHPM